MHMVVSTFSLRATIKRMVIDEEYNSLARAI